MPVVALKVVEKFDVPAGSCRPSLLIETEPPAIITILRLLSGTAYVSDERSDEVYYLAEKNFINPDDNIDEREIDRVLDYIFEERPEEDDLKQIFRRVGVLNRGFYTDILGELTFLFKSLSRENYTESFLFIYRILERISAACPLIYISKEKDFRSAHSFLSSIYDENKAPGELGMLQKFVHHYAGMSEGFGRATLDFSLAEVGDDLAAEILRQFRILVNPEVKSLSIDETNGTFSIPFKDVASFVVSVRNRAFHNLGARANLDLSNLGGSEPLFALLVPVLLYWFSYIFVEFAKWQISGVS